METPNCVFKLSPLLLSLLLRPLSLHWCTFSVEPVTPGWSALALLPLTITEYLLSQAHPNLALLHWKRCMEIGHILNHTPFLASLQNSGLCYTEMGNTVAAVATRRLEIEVALF